MPSRIRVTYSIGGVGIVPDEVTRQTGLTPSQIGQPGGVTRLSGRPLPKGGLWAMSVERQDQDELTWVLADLFEALNPGWDQLVDLGKTNYAVVSVTISSIGRLPAMVIDHIRLAAMAALQADLDFSLNLDEEEGKS